MQRNIMLISSNNAKNSESLKGVKAEFSTIVNDKKHDET
jgi:hypothetical protein